MLSWLKKIFIHKDYIILPCEADGFPEGCPYADTEGIHSDSIHGKWIHCWNCPVKG